MDTVIFNTQMEKPFETCTSFCILRGNRTLNYRVIMKLRMSTTSYSRIPGYSNLTGVIPISYCNLPGLLLSSALTLSNIVHSYFRVGNPPWIYCCGHSVTIKGIERILTRYNQEHRLICTTGCILDNCDFGLVIRPFLFIHRNSIYVFTKSDSYFYTSTSTLWKYENITKM